MISRKFPEPVEMERRHASVRRRETHAGNRGPRLVRAVFTEPLEARMGGAGINVK